MSKEMKGLDEGGITIRRELQDEFWKLASYHESLIKQRSRSRWLKKGDNNLKFFHAVMNWKIKRDTMRELMLDGK